MKTQHPSTASVESDDMICHFDKARDDEKSHGSREPSYKLFFINTPNEKKF